ncbi:MAG: hypothetical protein AABX73_02480 [Nanoarchaeota archaeon]
MANVFVPLILSVILSLVYIFSYKVSDKMEKWHEYILSIGSGMIIAILFSEVIPDLIENGSKFLSPTAISMSMLLGFAGYHAIEKYTYKHTRKTFVAERIGYLHIAGFFLDNFLEGFVLVLIFILPGTPGYLPYVLFIPLLLGDISASGMLRHINDKFKLKSFGLVFLSSSIFFGALSAIMLDLSKSTFYFALSFISGAFIYFVTRDELPRGRKGKLAVFLISLLIVVGLFVFLPKLF